MISIDNFPPDIASSLIRCGWSGLERDARSSISILKSDGYNVSDFIETFLKYFVDLTVWWNNEDVVDWFDFNVERAAGNIFPCRVKKYEQLINLALCPIGEADCANSTLLMAPQGGVFADAAGRFMFIGDSVEDAITSLLRGSHRRIII